MRMLTILLIITAGISAIYAKPGNPDPREIVLKCIQRHGGEKKFKKVRNIYAEMDIRHVSEKGDIESVFKEYYRSPDKLRIEIYPLIDPPTKISWDGENAWQLTQNSLEKTEDTRTRDRLKESLRFLKLMLLTNLFDEGASLEYLTYFESVGVHVIAWTNDKGQKIRLYIDSEYLLKGADFYWSGTEDLLTVKFYNHQKKAGGLYLPMNTEIYKKEKGKAKELVMTARLKRVKINALRNGNSFFTNLNEKARLKRRK